MKNGVWATPDGKKPNLEELCFACGVPYDKSQSHKADYDVDVMMQAYFKAKSWGFYQPLFASTPQPTSVAA
jgi:DNA polymerase-3 subunit epsilon